MTKTDAKEIFNKLNDIAISVARQDEKQGSANTHLKNIDDHLKMQNSSIGKHGKKLAIHGVWIYIISGIVMAVIVCAIQLLF